MTDAWVGANESGAEAKYVAPLRDALAGMTDLELGPWIEVGRQRRESSRRDDRSRVASPRAPEVRHPEG